MAAKLSHPKLIFDIIIDESFATVNTDKGLSPVNNKRILGLLNDYEDGKWRFQKFQNFIWDNIKETALSAKEREALIDDGESSVLTNSAKSLRFTDSDKDPTKGSELAEIVLYGIMKRHYNALPVVPKIFYKQNTQDFAKGADSVHVVIEDEKNFSLWLGEAKFYNSVEDDRLDTVIESIKNCLDTDKLKKENSIITNIKDLELLIENEDLKKEIIKTLDSRESIDHIKKKLHVPILLLHECSITKAESSLTDDYKNKVLTFNKERAQSYFTKQISKISSLIAGYSEIQFHIILFPVGDKKTIVDSFLAKASSHRS